MVELNIRPCDFWQMTFAEFKELLECYQDKQKRHIDELLYQAWHIEAFARQKNLPALSEILSKKEADKKQTTEQMIDKCKALNAMFGGITS